MEPKTWTDSEIISLIMATIRSVRADAIERQTKWTDREMADSILADLKEASLIDHTP